MTASGRRWAGALVVDAEREYACDRGVEKALAAAGEHRWGIVSMERDFRRIFPHHAGVAATNSDSRRRA